MTHAASHRLHSAGRCRGPDRRRRQGIYRGRRARRHAGAGSVVVERPRQAQYRPVRCRASAGAGRDRLQPRARPRQGADRGAVQSRPQRQCDHGIAGACMRRSWRKSTAIAFDPMATALALARVVAARRKSGAEPLTFGMTFPFSTHNYQLRFWMAAGGVDPDEDVRLVVLPPPYMVDSLANGQVDAFCVGAPWNSIAVDLGVGHILHFVSDILVRAAEKVLAFRQGWSEKNPELVAALVRAAFRAAEFIEQPQNRAEVAAHPGAAGAYRRRRRCHPAHARWPPQDFARRHHAREAAAICWWGAKARRGPIRCRPPGSTRRWCAGDRRRSARRRLKTAMAVFRPDLYDAALGRGGARPRFRRRRRLRRPGLRCPDDIAGHLAAFEIGRWKADPPVVLQYWAVILRRLVFEAACPKSIGGRARAWLPAILITY